MQNPEEKWQAEVNGEVYDTSFGELTVWISESSLLESDRVRRGNLRWLKAGKVPPLAKFFNAKATGKEPPLIQVSTTDAQSLNSDETYLDGKKLETLNEKVNSPHNLSDNQFSTNENNFAANELPRSESNERFCAIHGDIQAELACETCFHDFCNSCPQSAIGNDLNCPYCGAICSVIPQAFEIDEREIEYQKDVAKGFTFADFGKALEYPFNYKSSLLFGGFFMGLFSIGQSATGMTSIYLFVAALMCYLFANALSFGVLANTVENFSQGYKDRDFMPRFDDFELWDDVIQPFFLGIAAWIVSFGLLFALIIGIVWFAQNSAPVEIASPSDNLFEGVSSTVQTQKHVTKVLEKYKKQNAGRTNLKIGEDGLTEVQRNTLKEEAEFQKLNDFANNLRKQQLESAIGKSPETKNKEQMAMLGRILKTASGFLVLGGIALLWGLLYFPIACAVAGYTRSFSATINPLVGLDTIRHLGLDYVKILVMALLISIMSGIVTMLFATILSPFNLPAFGNIPATFLASFGTFYFHAVYAVMLGFALYKNADKLKLPRRR